MTKWLAALGMVLMAQPASAAVVSAGANGFVVRHSATLVVPPDAAFRAFANVSGWWNKDHTYSGDSVSLTLSPVAGGCFCERLKNGGGIEHLRVTFVQPGERMLLTGALGPLLYEAVAGAMDVQFEKIAGGTRVTMTYKVAGFANGGADKLSAPVDTVLGEQMRRYRAFASARRPRG